MNTHAFKSFYTWSLALILLTCMILFMIDKDSHRLSDLLKPGNLVALAIYAIPTYLLCFGLYRFFESKKRPNSSLLALLIGIPLGIVSVMLILSANMGRL